MRLIVEELRAGRPVVRRRVSKGEPVQNGLDGKLTMLAKPYQDYKKVKDLERQGSRCVRFFDNVLEGSVVAKIALPTSGKSGVDALGREIKAACGAPVK
ncbi:flagellar assembly protein A, partial [Arthrospira platensis SPKY1]|nr:flagellar assembly protein A [Arthrospira platensis SPKY1]